MSSLYESYNYDASYRAVLSSNDVVKVFTEKDFIEVNSQISFDIEDSNKTSFNYFASIFNFRSSFANRKKLSWFQMIFTSFFLISITLLPVALQNAQLKTYPLTTFVSDVFDPLSTDVMKDIQEHVVIKDQELTYTGTNPVHKTSKGQVILGQEAKTSEGKELTLHFDRKQLIISKENKELATVSYQAINQESLRDLQ